MARGNLPPPLLRGCGVVVSWGLRKKRPLFTYIVQMGVHSAAMFLLSTNIFFRGRLEKMV